MAKGCALEAKKEPSRFRQLNILIKKNKTKQPNKTKTKNSTKTDTFLNTQFISSSFGK